MEFADAETELPVPLESVICTQELKLRPARQPDFEALTGAMLRLARTLANSPKQILQQLVETALDLCRAQSAGISLLEEENGQQIFRWHGVAGLYAPHLWGTTPRGFSPCGTVLDTDSILLMSRLDRHFTYFAQVEPRIAEALLIPFHVGGQAVGTIWVIAHDQSLRFDAEDARVMKTLAEFAANAYQALSRDSLAKHAAKVEHQKMDREIQKTSASSWPSPEDVRDLENFIDRAPASKGNVTLNDLEREHIIRVLRECRGSVTVAARTLGLARTTLHARMRKFGISRDFAARS